MILSCLALGLLATTLAVTCIRRAFAALGIDVLEMMLFFGLAERVTLPHPLVVVGSRGREEHLARARYDGYTHRVREAA